MGKIQTVGKRGGMPHGKIKILFFPRNVHTERIGAGPCMACDHAPKEKELWEKNMGNMEKIGYWWEKDMGKMGKIGYSMGKKIGIWEKLGKVPVASSARRII